MKKSFNIVVANYRGEHRLVGTSKKDGRSYAWMLRGKSLHGISSEFKYSSSRTACQELAHYLGGSPLGVEYYVPLAEFTNTKQAEEWCTNVSLEGLSEEEKKHLKQLHKQRKKEVVPKKRRRKNEDNEL